uniref:Ovule protein n=1 Tax=Steinernema glaseri TaxID=37863 RepID=A0A1I7Z484_9BILA
MKTWTKRKQFRKGETPMFKKSWVVTACEEDHSEAVTVGCTSYFSLNNGDYNRLENQDDKLGNKTKKICIGRESNPGRPRGRRAFYH